MAISNKYTYLIKRGYRLLNRGSLSRLDNMADQSIFIDYAISINRCT